VEPVQKKPPETVQPQAQPVVPEKVDESIEKISRAVNFNRREWTILIALSVGLIIVLIILITLVVMSG
jgi:uncharacterized membrane protein YukC